MYEFFDFNSYREKDDGDKIAQLVMVQEPKYVKPKAVRKPRTAKPKAKDVDRNASRELRIKTCPDCNGNPETEPFSTASDKGGTFVGTKCSKCWEIVTFTLK